MCLFPSSVSVFDSRLRRACSPSAGSTLPCSASPTSPQSGGSTLRRTRSPPSAQVRRASGRGSHTDRGWNACRGWNGTGSRAVECNAMDGLKQTLRMQCPVPHSCHALFDCHALLVCRECNQMCWSSAHVIPHTHTRRSGETARGKDTAVSSHSNVQTHHPAHADSTRCSLAQTPSGICRRNDDDVTISGISRHHCHYAALVSPAQATRADPGADTPQAHRNRASRTPTADIKTCKKNYEKLAQVRVRCAGGG
eukprot:2933627-Rhodomonas_salina.1